MPDASAPPPPALPILCLGETLWDVLPDGEFLGGAPFNVAAHLARLGAPVRLVTRIGADARGRAALERMQALGLDTALVQVDPSLPTGEAHARIDARGAATYDFTAPAAWDRIEADAAVLETAHRSAALVYGTLAQRTPAGLAAARRVVEAARWRVLDLNLRPPHDGRELALAALARADFVKMNDLEARRVAMWLGVPDEPAELFECLGTRFGTTSVCITRGERGALLWHEAQTVEQPAVPCEVADTVGAGDAFLAMLIAELLVATPAPLAMRRAAELAAFVASRAGAVPDYEAQAFRR